MTVSVSHHYHSPLVDVHDFACSAPAGHCSGEEVAVADEIAFVRQGVFVKRAADGRHLLDPTRVAVFRRNQPYRVDHPGEHGDHSTVLTFAAGPLHEAMTGFSRNAASPFAALPSAIPVNRELLLAFHGLLGALRLTPVDDLLVDERAMRALDAFRDAAAEAGPSPARPGRENGRVEQARSLLSERWSSRLTLAALAAELGVSPYHLCRKFRAATGTTIHRYVTTLRMAAALERLSDYRDNLAQLALELGYASHSHFTTAFRSHFGLPPTAAGRRLHGLRKNPEAPATPTQ